MICAVSGGPDSLALLVLAAANGNDVTAVHVDHGLRPDSGNDGGVVRAAADRFGARCEIRQVVVARGGNLEARARVARIEALPRGAATGHTADDQAETMLLNLLRGSGLAGLAGMRPGPAKPILRLRRSDTRALCVELGLTPVEDPSNTDAMIRRNRVRHEVLPLLDDVAGRDVAALLARASSLVRDDDDFLESLSAELDPCDARALACAPEPLARRAIRRWLSRPYPPDRAAVGRVLAVARGERVACEVKGGLRVRRSAGRLSVAPYPDTPRGPSGPAPGPPGADD